MSFTSERDNQASRKFSLVRIEPARWVNNDLTDNEDGTYSVTLSGFIVSKVQENGTDLTLVTGTPASGQFSFNEANGSLVVYPATAPSATNSIVVFHYLFYTSQRTRSTTEDPEDSSTSTRDWLPRIESSPVINQSIENIDRGFFEIDASVINILNDNYEFNTYLGDYDSLNNKEVRVWFCIDDTTNIQKAFIGLITGFTLANRVVALSIENNFSKLSLPALIGDSRADCYWNLQDYSTLDPSKNGNIIPFYFGRTSRYHLRNISNAGTTAFALDLESLPEAVCTVYSDRTDTDKNRSWGLGRVMGTGLEQQIYSISTSFHGSASYTRVTIANLTSIFAGDVGKTLVGSAGTEYVRVIYVDESNSHVYLDKTSVSSWTSLTINGVSICVAQDGDNKAKWYYPFETRDYTITYGTTASDNSIVSIVFTNNFESNFSGMETINPTDHQIKYRLKPKHSEAGHGKTLQYILNKVGGLTLNTSTFTAADTNLKTNVAFSIPYFDESDFNEYTKYIGELLQSTFGYLRLNNSFQVEYNLFSTPSSSGTQITDFQIVKDQYNAEISYKDMTDQIVFYNPHYASTEHSPVSGQSTSSNRAKYLHGIDKTTRFRHVLEAISTSMGNIINNRSNRKGTYRLTTKTLNLDSLIGENFNVAYGTIDGGATSPCVIMRVDKSPTQTTILLNDLIGV